MTFSPWLDWLRTASTPDAPRSAVSIGLGDQRLDLLRGQAGALGQDDHARPVEVGEHVDRQRGGQVAAVDQHDEARGQDQRPVRSEKRMTALSMAQSSVHFPSSSFL